MDIGDANGQMLNEMCRALKRRRAEDGFTYRTHYSGRNDPSNPSTWALPVCHGPTWITAISIVRYLQAFPQYEGVLFEFGVTVNTDLLAERDLPSS